VEKRNLGDNSEDGALTLGDASGRQPQQSPGAGIAAGGKRPVLGSREVRFTGYGGVISGKTPGWDDPGREQIG
jgi:hypothetical protein